MTAAKKPAHWNDEQEDEDNLFSVLGLCGCGDPRAVMRLFLRSLERYDGDRERGDYREELKANFPDHPGERVLDSDLVWAHIYQLDHLGLTEHGTSAWCGWLTAEGVFVRDKLREYLATCGDADE